MAVHNRDQIVHSETEQVILDIYCWIRAKCLKVSDTVQEHCVGSKGRGRPVRGQIEFEILRLRVCLTQTDGSGSAGLTGNKKGRDVVWQQSSFIISSQAGNPVERLVCQI